MRIRFPAAALGLVATLGLGCASSGPHAAAPPDEPLACTLSPEELASRRDELLPGLVRRAVAREDLENGMRLRFESTDGLLAELAKAIEQERACCAFLRFAIGIEPEGGPIVVDVTGPPGTRELLRSL